VLPPIFTEEAFPIPTLSHVHPAPACGPSSSRAEASAGALDLKELFWIFLLASFWGCIGETLFMLLTTGRLQNRSGVLYGPFSLVWGLGAVLFTLLFHSLAQRRRLFWAGALLGTCYEYLCSWLQEMFFGSCFWDYSHLPFNLNGRVNLLFSAFWGAAAVLWRRQLYPRLRRRLDSARPSRCLTVILAALMAGNIALSAAALVRMDRRQCGLPAVTELELLLDRFYPDQVLQRTFSNLTYIGTDAARAASGVPRPWDIPD